MSADLHCLKCFKLIEGEPVWENNTLICKECAVEKPPEKPPKEVLPVIEVSPNNKCTNCWGRGKVKTQTTKLPSNINMKNVNMTGGAKITINQWCGCVLGRANKQAKALGLEEGAPYNIKLKGEK